MRSFKLSGKLKQDIMFSVIAMHATGAEEGLKYWLSTKLAKAKFEKEALIIKTLERGHKVEKEAGSYEPDKFIFKIVATLIVTHTLKCYMEVVGDDIGALPNVFEQEACKELPLLLEHATELATPILIDFSATGSLTQEEQQYNNGEVVEEISHV